MEEHFETFNSETWRAASNVMKEESESPAFDTDQMTRDWETYGAQNLKISTEQKQQDNGRGLSRKAAKT